MKKINADVFVKKYRIIPSPSEHVVMDVAGNKIVSCPTEQELNLTHNYNIYFR